MSQKDDASLIEKAKRQAKDKLSCLDVGHEELSRVEFYKERSRCFAELLNVVREEYTLDDRMCRILRSQGYGVEKEIDLSSDERKALQFSRQEWSEMSPQEAKKWSEIRERAEKSFEKFEQKNELIADQIVQEWFSEKNFELFWFIELGFILNLIERTKADQLMRKAATFTRPGFEQL